MSSKFGGLSFESSFLGAYFGLLHHTQSSAARQDGYCKRLEHMFVQSVQWNISLPAHIQTLLNMCCRPLFSFMLFDADRCVTNREKSELICQLEDVETDDNIHYSEEQAGFRAGCSTVDQIFTLCLLAEKVFSKDLYICYIDFKKAFDSIWRRGLWKVVRHLGYPTKVVRILEKSFICPVYGLADKEIMFWCSLICSILVVTKPLTDEHASKSR